MAKSMNHKIFHRAKYKASDMEWIPDQGLLRVRRSDMTITPMRRYVEPGETGELSWEQIVPALDYNDEMQVVISVVSPTTGSNALFYLAFDDKINCIHTYLPCRAEYRKKGISLEYYYGQ